MRDSPASGEPAVTPVDFVAASFSEFDGKDRLSLEFSIAMEVANVMG